MTNKLELVSFKLCPFVQRSVITLLYKKVDFEITYIDLANKPDWFLKISPLGKVPVLRVGENTIFESAVINEYLDETNPPALHPVDPLRKAHNRAWIEFGAGIMMNLAQYIFATEETQFLERRKLLQDNLGKVEEILEKGPFFNGERFALIDASFAPIFMRIAIIEEKIEEKDSCA